MAVYKVICSHQGPVWLLPSLDPFFHLHISHSLPWLQHSTCWPFRHSLMSPVTPHGYVRTNHMEGRIGLALTLMSTMVVGMDLALRKQQWAKRWKGIVFQKEIIIWTKKRVVVVFVAAKTQQTSTTLASKSVVSEGPISVWDPRCSTLPCAVLCLQSRTLLQKYASGRWRLRRMPSGKLLPNTRFVSDSYCTSVSRNSL